MLDLKTSAAILTIAFAGAAQAATITFDSATLESSLTAPYTESGFIMSLEAGHYDIRGGGTGGTNYVNINRTRSSGPATITFARVGGGVFDLTGFDFFADGAGLLTSSNGGSVELSDPGLLAFGHEWSGITSFSLATTPNSSLGIDTINVAAVPEPETYALMLTGLLAVGGAVRSRRR